MRRYECRMCNHFLDCLFLKFWFAVDNLIDTLVNGSFKELFYFLARYLEDLVRCNTSVIHCESEVSC